MHKLRGNTEGTGTGPQVSAWAQLPPLLGLPGPDNTWLRGLQSFPWLRAAVPEGRSLDALGIPSDGGGINTSVAVYIVSVSVPLPSDSNESLKASAEQKQIMLRVFMPVSLLFLSFLCES